MYSRITFGYPTLREYGCPNDYLKHSFTVGGT